ncbi:hypothetical protein LARV_00762 [Longilinea arvoryzae]|uniref:Uncharacterized protein n=1 Tax=Longilinea arvoryzae TaxID=360412 RepID=A0A0S7BCK3_9CHLR|nr:hypothetical protein [Longilinea arvoryzae]GAP13021.1 hypothetical protein LARV_00762 [Longilinea arvoryzae]
MKYYRNNFHPVIFFLLMAMIALAACAPGQNIPPVLATGTATRAIQTKTNTPEMKATSTPTPEHRCPVLTGGAELKGYSNLVELDAAILDYVNHGGDPASLKSLLASTDLLRVSAAVADLDGDALEEIVVSGSITIINEGSPSDDINLINIYQCSTNAYRLVQSFQTEDVSSGDILFVEQIFEKELPFIIVKIRATIGWGTKYYAFGWRENQWKEIFLGGGLVGSEIMLDDQDGDGTKEVLVLTGNSTGFWGGASRDEIDVFAWNGKNFEYSYSDLPPGDDRVHYLGDGADASKKGNLMMAIAYYEIAARDSNLSSYFTTYELTENQTELAEPYQKAFAFFRIVVIWFSQNRVDMADEVIHEMSESFPDGTPGNEFVVVAKEFATQYEVTHKAMTSCLEAVKILDTDYPDVLKGHIGDWGFMNVSYSATSEFCKLN